MKGIRNVLFDLDGTLVDSSGTIARSIAFALGQLGVEHTQGPAVESFIGLPLLDIFREFFGLTDDEAYAAIDIYRQHYDSLNQAGTRVYDHVPQVLPALKAAGYRLFVATVKPTSIAERVLRDLGLDQPFDGVAGSSMDSARRTKSRIIAHALATFGLDPSQSVMIGDRDQDILGARENGMPAIAVTYGFGSRRELEACSAAHIVDHSADILGLLVNPSGVE